MADLPQARRYLTRARAKAEDNTVDAKLPYQWKGQKAAEGRKAIAIADTQPSPVDTEAGPSAARATRATRRTGASKTAGETTGVKAAPKRKSTKGAGGAAKRTLATKTSAPTAKKPPKKVAFNDDKENLIPLGREDAATRLQGDDTDDLMSSMGALSVKPLRVPSTKLRLPTTNTTVSSAFDPLPALSPSKARRIPQSLRLNDEGMEDELSSPTSPIHKLVAKPIRGGLCAARGLTEAAVAMDLKRPLDLSASLLTSPARRPPSSPFKPTTANTLFPRSDTDPTNSVPKSSLASPARRPPSTTAGIGSPIKGSFRFDSKVTLGVGIPDLPKYGVRSPPKRVKMSTFVKTDEAADELGMDMDDYMLGRSPSRVVKKRVENQGPAQSIPTKNEYTNLGIDALTMGDDDPKPCSPSDVLTTPPVASLAEYSDTMAEQSEQDTKLEGVGRDGDGDVSMEDLDDGHLMNRTTLSPTKYKSPNEGGSSYGFFSLGGDEDDELLDPGDTENAFGPFSGVELQQSERKNLFPNAAFKQPEAGIPIDPFLLTLGVPDNFLEAVESPARKTTVPVKLHSIDDILSDGEDDQENYGPPSQNDTSSKKCNDDRSARRYSIVRPPGVLAGAVVFVDVYTSEGADASGAFVEALRGLGAKVLKSWNWNPNSTGGPGEGERKVGITHVVFKDGSPRTLQKVKDSKGVVLCVGVGWVTSCEEEQAWVDEGNYPVDLDHVPRGGHRVSIECCFDLEVMS